MVHKYTTRGIRVASFLALALLSACAAKQNNAPEPAIIGRPAPRPPQYPAVKVEAPDQALRQRAVSTIRTALTAEDNFIRANAIEASRNLPRDMASEAILFAANDRSAVVRFAALMTAGETRLAAARPIAQKLVQDTDRNVQAAAVFTLHRLGDTRYSRRLEQFAIDPDRRLRANTAVLLGLLGDKSAAVLLERLMRDQDEAIRLQAAEGLWRLKSDPNALQLLVTATISRYPDEQIIAATALAGPKNIRVAEHIRAMLTTSYAEVNLAAARGLGMLGLDEGYGVAIEGAKSKDARQRHMAALAFGAIGRTDAQQTLSRLLDDNDASVKLAAASAILQLR